MAKLLHIREYMTPSPKTIVPTASLQAARRLMLELEVHHLPVVDANALLVGLISSRDIAAAESLLGDLADTATVALVMTSGPFSCGPEAHIGAVAREMLAKGAGSAIVVDRDHPCTVLGIFTVTDALRLIADLDA